MPLSTVEARQYDQKTGHQRPQVTAHNMTGMEQMKLSDEIDRAAYANVADPAPDQECVERWTKLDPSGKWCYICQHIASTYDSWATHCSMSASIGFVFHI